MLVRPADERDAPALAAIYEPIVRGTAISFELAPPDAEEMRRRVAATTARHPWLVADDGGTTVGYAYASSFRAREAYRFACESTVYVAEGARGRGAASRLYRALFALLEAQGFAVAYAGIALPNEPSVRLHERLGFRAVGVFSRAGWKLGRWHDVGFWERPLAGGPPAGEPIPWAALRATEAASAVLAGA